MDDVEDECLNLYKDQIIATVVETRITLELPLEVALVVLELALFDGVDTVFAEVNHLAEAANLRGHICDVEPTAALLARLQ